MSSFNFLAAINGEPIYFDSLLIKPKYDPSCERWIFRHNESLCTHYFFKNGNHTVYDNPENSLTTDPPKKKVKKTVCVTLYYYGDNDIGATTMDKEHLSIDVRLIETFSREIEVEE